MVKTDINSNAQTPVRKKKGNIIKCADSVWLMHAWGGGDENVAWADEGIFDKGTT